MLFFIWSLPFFTNKYDFFKIIKIINKKEQIFIEK